MLTVSVLRTFELVLVFGSAGSVSGLVVVRFLAVLNPAESRDTSGA